MWGWGGFGIGTGVCRFLGLLFSLADWFWAGFSCFRLGWCGLPGDKFFGWVGIIWSFWFACWFCWGVGLLGGCGVISAGLAVFKVWGFAVATVRLVTMDS